MRFARREPRSARVIDKDDVAERGPDLEAYATPELTRHGSLEELTQGQGTKQGEKFSAVDD